MAAARLDDDARQDLVMLDANFRLHTSLGARADGLFSRASVQGLQAPVDLLMVDLDGDGVDDPVVSGWTNLQTFRTFPGANGVSFSKVADLSLGSGASSRPVSLLGSGDFNSDGNPDLLVLCGQDGMLCWVETSAGGGLGEVHPIALVGRLDIPFSGEQLVTRDQTPVPSAAVVADFDQDGIDDLVTVTGYSTDVFGNPTGEPGVWIHRIRGDGALDPPLPLATLPHIPDWLLVRDLDC